MVVEFQKFTMSGSDYKTKFGKVRRKDFCRQVEKEPPGGGHGNLLQYSSLEDPHGQRSLEGYSPPGCKESDMTEWLSTSTQTVGEVSLLNFEDIVFQYLL